MTTYGDTLAGYMLGNSSDGSGLWAFLLLLIAVIAMIAAAVILIRAVKTAVDAV